LDVVVFLMLILKPTGSYYNMPWSDNDYVLLDAAKIVGRIGAGD